MQPNLLSEGSGVEFYYFYFFSKSLKLPENHLSPTWSNKWRIFGKVHRNKYGQLATWLLRLLSWFGQDKVLSSSASLVLRVQDLTNHFLALVLAFGLGTNFIPTLSGGLTTSHLGLGQTLNLIYFYINLLISITVCSAQD